MSIADISFHDWLAEEKRRVRGEEMRREREGRWPVAEPKDPENTELMEILLCPSCESELGAPPCSPVHALLQDHPEQHPLLLPLVEAAIASTRHDETKLCPVCKYHPPVATGDCPHVVDRYGQVWMSKKKWEELMDGHAETLGELDDLENRHADYIESVRLERIRMEEDRERWATEWASEKFERLCADARLADQRPSNKFRREFLTMMIEDR